jgi:hypothetical protein
MKRLIVVLAALAIVAGCGSDDPDGASSAPTTHQAARTTRPGAQSTSDLKAIYDSKLEPLGLRVSRAGLTNSPGDDAYSTAGSHAALYVVPIEGADTSPDAYVERLPALARAVIPDVFRRYKVMTVDVCQEPPGTAPGDTPAPETVMLVSRVQSSKLDWDGLTPADFVAMQAEGPARMSLVVSDRVAGSATWRRLAEQG